MIKKHFATWFALTVVSLLAAFSPGRARAEADTNQPSEKPTLKVLGATYSFGGQFNDVTERVKELLRDHVSFSANPEWLGADPHPGMNKALFVYCEVDGKPAVLSLGEGEDLSREILLKNAQKVQATSEPDIEPHDPADDSAVSEYADNREAFPELNLAVKDDGSPIMQTLRLNDKVMVDGGQRYSGFRFKVDRTAAAEKQKVADKTKMRLFWFFPSAPGLQSWFIEPVKGRMRGFSNFYPIKTDAFKNGADLLPKNKRNIVIQHLAADRLKEGEEYIIWFACSDAAAVPTEMNLSVGFKADDRDFNHWQDLTDIAKFLGLTPSGEKVGVDQRAY